RRRRVARDRWAFDRLSIVLGRRGNRKRKQDRRAPRQLSLRHLCTPHDINPSSSLSHSFTRTAVAVPPSPQPGLRAVTCITIGIGMSLGGGSRNVMPLRI